MTLAAARNKGERIDQTGLAARPVSHHRDVSNFRAPILTHTHAPRFCLCEPADSGSGAEPHAQLLIADLARQITVGAGDGAAGLTAVTDADEHNRLAGIGGTPLPPSLVGEDAL